jgi:ABC-2 type transport system permease protein
VAPPKITVDNGAVMVPMPLDWRYIGWAGLISVVILIGGYATFNKLKWRFVERP